MKIFTEVVSQADQILCELILPFELRQKSRLSVQLENGEKAALILDRGIVLRDGDLLKTEQNEVVQVKAASESVSTVCCDDTLLLMRASYHLGNRHVPLQISHGWLRYEHDHVLDEMIRQMGLTVIIEQAPFEPESGAYYSHGSHHPHHHN